MTAAARNHRPTSQPAARTRRRGTFVRAARAAAEGLAPKPGAAGGGGGGGAYPPAVAPPPALPGATVARAIDPDDGDGPPQLSPPAAGPEGPSLPTAPAG